MSKRPKEPSTIYGTSPQGKGITQLQSVLGTALGLSVLDETGSAEVDVSEHRKPPSRIPRFVACLHFLFIISMAILFRLIRARFRCFRVRVFGKVVFLGAWRLHW